MAFYHRRPHQQQQPNASSPAAGPSSSAVSSSNATAVAAPPIPPLPTEVPPPIPTRTRFNSTAGPPPSSRHHRHRSSAVGGSRGTNGLPPASPEVISNLITSLSGISKPADDYFEGKQTSNSASSSRLAAPPVVIPTSRSNPNPAASLNPSPSGSFGVDYGAYSRPSPNGSPPESLDDIAASAPVVRTSKPTSGYSPLSPPKTPRSRSRSSRDVSAGLRSLLRSSSSAPASRPCSSTNSARDDDAHSIGNLSIERRSTAASASAAVTPDQPLRGRRSQDSWGRRTSSRSYKGLMYMTSRERLRDNEERKVTSSSASLGAASVHSGCGKADPFLAESAISEEPSASDAPSMAAKEAAVSPRPIPNRESSLSKSAQNSGKRSSGRRSYTRERDGTTEQPTESEGRKPRAAKKVPARLDLDNPTKGKGGENGAQLNTPNTQRFLETIRDDYLAFDAHTPEAENEADEGAPFPAVSQNRRRSTQSVDRNGRQRSAAATPQDENVWPMRSSSRIKRLSQPGSPTAANDGPASHISQDLGAREPENFVGGAPLERLDSADSIDDAVDAYLSAPRLSHKIRHPQTGRIICFSEVGDPDGSAVFCCVGMGLTRYITAFYDELALTLKLRLITPDRPGVGDSEPYPDGTTTPLNWPDDVYAICQALKVTKFSILAHSAGAIYALATALRMPQHIRGRIHLLAPWIPPSQMSVFGGAHDSAPAHSIPTSQRILRALPTPVLKVANSSFMSATSTSITTSLPKNSRRSKRKSAQSKEASARNITPAVLDKENIGQTGDQKKAASATTGHSGGAGLGNQGSSHNNISNGNAWTTTTITGGNAANGPIDNILDAVAEAEAEQERQMTYDMRLTHAIWDLATTGANPAVDLLICLERRHTIGFRYVDINRAVIIHHGSRDTRVPVDNVRWLGKTMRRCEVRVLEGEGHGLMASASVMGNVLMEISKEWEDWMRATGADGRGKERESRSRRGTIHR
ncbi:alpha/beta hydrolase fold [Geosmithia morbida]|uniref:Alpha/beta hydrolase fold n=1 Tax=Geosmithia morbida TaxID=1094350 RepID=A0A9P4YUF6_9HYPO|nr:alpha/beta hydrolase fold [Geosmithia morbida]KAF4122260.1 alpha/beta hydrolase fold [Geosmithia morbida]